MATRTQKYANIFQLRSQTGHKYFTRPTVRIRNLLNRPQNSGAVIKMSFEEAFAKAL